MNATMAPPSTSAWEAAAELDFQQLAAVMVASVSRFVSVLALGAVCVRHSLAAPHMEARATGTLDSFIASESPIALQGVLNNIGAAGADAAGAAPGIVVASPSKNNPDCTYISIPCHTCP